jgi:hypothetical protein
MLDIVEARGLRLPWVAERLGVSLGHLHNMIRGRRIWMPDTVARACDLFQLPAHVLFYDPCLPDRDGRLLDAGEAVEPEALAAAS